MESNLIEGLKLMVIGMSTVFVFLSLMIMVISLVARLTKKHAIVELEELKQNKLARASKGKKSKRSAQQSAPAVVIAAAVSAYEADVKQQKEEGRG